MFKDNVTKKIFFAILTSPFVILPFVLGATSAMFSWAIGGKAALFFGLCGMMGSFGIFFTKLFLSGDNIAKDIMDAAEKKAKEEREKDLDNLAVILPNDRDERDDDLLVDLREIYKRFEEEKEGNDEGSSLSLRLEIGSKIDALFKESIKSLKTSHELLKQAKSTRQKSLKAELLGRRDEILDEIEGAVKKISDSTLLFKKKIEAGSLVSETDKLRSLSDELDDSITIAKRVEERLRSNSEEIKTHD